MFNPPPWLSAYIDARYRNLTAWAAVTCAFPTSSAAAIIEVQSTFVIDLPRELLVALRAKLHVRLGQEHALEIGPVASVTAQAIDAEVLVPRVDCFLADGMSRVRAVIVARRAGLDDGRLLQKVCSI
jgi:hypothetical protein